VPFISQLALKLKRINAIRQKAEEIGALGSMHYAFVVVAMVATQQQSQPVQAALPLVVLAQLCDLD
jgi:hypothetical protein